MRLESMQHRALSWTLAVAVGLAAAAPDAVAQTRDTTADPRVGLRAGWNDAGTAIRNLRLVAHRDRPQGFVNPQAMGDFGFANSDMAFRGNLLFQGNFNGFQVWDVSNPANPRLRTSFACPGGQGDLSVHGNLLFMSVEETRGRLDCGPQGVPDSVSTDRFRGVRIFDISNLDRPRQIAAVQSCRGSHTHTLVTDPKDKENVYVYISGTAGARSPNELAGCFRGTGPEDTTTAYFRIEVVQVPLAAPQNARIISMPRIFADTAGNIAGLWAGGAHGPGTQRTSQTNQCHDITVYPAIGLAAGACAGNGILLDISDVKNPRRIDEVVDPNFAYWHSATFNNDGTTVLYTDEWGGGTQARCRATDRPEWGANAIFSLTSNRQLEHESYYKLPAAQTAAENCVAHNGTLIPVPGRDIMVQAWYQGGVSVFDFTNPDKPFEIAFFDRGPMSDELVLGGQWSSYWYNGNIYGSEIGRGLDVLELTPSEFLTQNEIEAAKLARVAVWNPQLQERITWPASFVVARAYVDGLAREDALRGAWATSVRASLDRAERAQGAARRTALTQLATRIETDAKSSPAAARLTALATTIRGIGGQ